jgi:hypothetical protein
LNHSTLKQANMAHSNNSLITGKLSGSLGKELVFREWEGKTVVAKAPGRRKGGPTPPQAETQENFLLGSRYARAVIRNPDRSMADAYAAVLKPRQNVYSRALEDFLSPPVVKKINALNYKGTAGDKIAVRAMDDFRVVAVRVEIYAADGTLLETGNAEQNANDIDWTYTATQVNTQLAGSKIKAIATDIPGNEGMLEGT